MLTVAALVCLLAACGRKKETETIISTNVEQPKPAQPVRMQGYEQRSEVDWAGGKYTCVINRMADDSLAMVTDERGQKFVDNRIELKITRNDGSVFLQKTFTKATFDNWLDDDYRATGVMEGFVFDRVNGAELLFAASVCHPQTDEYIPLVVSVGRDGRINIERDTVMDTNGEEEM